MRVVENSGGRREPRQDLGDPRSGTLRGGVPNFPTAPRGTPPSTSRQARHGGARAGCRGPSRASISSLDLAAVRSCRHFRSRGGRRAIGARNRQAGQKRATPSSKSTPWMPNGARQEWGIPRIRKSTLRVKILVRLRGGGDGFLRSMGSVFLPGRQEGSLGHFQPAPHATFGTFANPRTRAATSSPAVIRKSA